MAKTELIENLKIALENGEIQPSDLLALVLDTVEECRDRCEDADERMQARIFRGYFHDTANLMNGLRREGF